MKSIKEFLLRILIYNDEFLSGRQRVVLNRIILFVLLIVGIIPLVFLNILVRIGRIPSVGYVYDSFRATSFEEVFTFTTALFCAPLVAAFIALYMIITSLEFIYTKLLTFSSTHIYPKLVQTRTMIREFVHWFPKTGLWKNALFYLFGVSANG